MGDQLYCDSQGIIHGEIQCIDIGNIINIQCTLVKFIIFYSIVILTKFHLKIEFFCFFPKLL